ncbi:TonB-dependent receptor domain-containing protein [Parvularcula lutaonensis]|uniref:TonB-dependent receptor domain-containing protein n=1 Tax=Parvularcula lutaonensis TaxID=491923 RepID=A0ABV7M959_9PROT|nr:TonB-dependent receptor [Parvularcula lutaonensis]
MSSAEQLKALLALTTSVAALGLGAAYAQDGDDPVEIAPAVEDVDSGDTIVVTGSRIRRSEVEASAPIFTFGEEEIQDRGFTNVAEVLNQSPLFGGSLTPNGAQNGFTAGQNQVNLFDLGTARTLTLINGRRMVSSSAASFFNDAGGQVDLNTIPVSLVDRIETVPLTGAATYGSDAIAGTVNVILKDDFEGFEVRGQYGDQFDASAPSYQISTLMGTNFADGRGNVTFSAEYTRDEGLFLCEREYLCVDDPNYVNIGNRALDLDGDGQADNLLNGTTDINGDGVNNDAIRLIYFNQTVQLFGPGGTASTAAVIPSFGIGAFPDGNIYEFDNNGELQPCEPGITPPGSSAFFAQGGTCGIDFFDSVAQIRSPVERFNAFAAMNYDITDNVKFRQDFLFANTSGEELVNQGGFQTWAFGGTSAALTIRDDNPFLSAQARQVLADNGVTQFLLNRFNNDLVGQGANSNETFVWRVSNILEGQFEYGGRNFYWDVSGQYGSSDITTKTFGIVDGRFINAIDARVVDDNLLQGIVDAGAATDLDDALAVLRASNPTVGLVDRGDIICGAFADLAAGTLTGFNSRASGGGVTDEDLPFLDGCQPLNLFGAGNASPEALAFINGGTQQSQSSNEQTVYAANFGGEAFEVPAGIVSFNIGVESRREVVEYGPGMGQIVPITRSTTARPISGKAVTKEIYGEVLVPIVSPDMNIPLVQNLEFTGAYRSQGFEVTGPDGQKSDTDSQVYSASLAYEPTDYLKFRATYATSFRNPPFNDLFYPSTQAFISGAAPCDNRFIGEGPNPSVRAANCAAEGIPAGFVSNISNATISTGQQVGNPNLQPEETKAYTIGAVFTPSFVPGLEMAIDYYNLEIEEQISFLEFDDLAAVCYDSTDFPNEPACSTFTRDSNFQVITASETPANAALSSFESVTARIFYARDVADIIPTDRDYGRLTWNWFMQHNIQNESQATPASEIQDDVGDFGDPKWIGTFDTAWDWENWRVTHRLRYRYGMDISTIDGRYYAKDFTLLDNGVYQVEIDNSLDPRWIQDAGVAYTFNDKYTIQANIRNLTDRKPNRQEFAAGAFGVDEQLGRRYTIRLVGRF